MIYVCVCLCCSVIENGAFKEFVAAVSNSTPMPPRASRSQLCEKVNIVSYSTDCHLVLSQGLKDGMLKSQQSLVQWSVLYLNFLRLSISSWGWKFCELKLLNSSVLLQVKGIMTMHVVVATL